MPCIEHRKIERRRGRMMAADFKEVSVNPVFTGLRRILKKEKRIKRGGRYGSRTICKLMGSSACFHYYIGNAAKPAKPYKQWICRIS